MKDIKTNLNYGREIDMDSEMKEMGRKAEPVVPLTEAQQKLVEENIGLIAGYANLHGLDLSNNRIYAYEDLYGTLAIGLCKAISSYDPNKGALSSYVYRAMDYEMLTARKKFKLHNPPVVCYINDMIKNPNDQEDNRYAENWGRDSFFYKYNLFNPDETDIVELQMILDEEYENYGKFGKVFREIMEKGLSFADAGKELGLTKQRVWHIFFRRFVPTVRRRLMGEEVKDRRVII